MRALIAASDLFSFTGGGQSFFQKYINRSEHEFYCFRMNETDAAGLRPANVFEVPVTDIYRKNFGNFNLEGIFTPGCTKSLETVKYSVLYILDLAASVEGMEFDILEIPDYFAFGALLPYALRYHGVKIGKVVLSMHGRLSDAMLRNWSAPAPEDYDLIRLYEELLYKSADIRYAISHTYLAEWGQLADVPGQLIDIREFLNSDEFKSSPGRKESPERAAPSMTFIGRQEKWKGPDLFIDICSRLPRDLYSSVRILGGEVEVDGVRSRPILENMAAMRGLKLEVDRLPRDQLVAALQTQRLVGFMPSRYDTFNLAALEAVLAGCPVVVGADCGVCHFLDTVAPGHPGIRLDPENLAPAVNELVRRLSDYDAWRDECRLYAERLSSAGTRAVPYGAASQSTWSLETQFDVVARQQLEDVFDAVEHRLSSAAFGLIWETARRGLEQRLDQMNDGNDGLPDKKFLLEVFDSSCDLGGQIARLNKSAGNAPVLVDDAAVALFDRYSRGGDRASAWWYLSHLELARGNDLLYATYQIRHARLSNTPLKDVAQVSEILVRRGYATEASLIDSLYGRGSDEALSSYIDSQLRHGGSSDYEFDELIEHRGDGPKVSVIVSVYNGESKAEIFASQFLLLSKATKAQIEIIFVDAASPDGSRDALLAATKDLNIAYVYARCPRRETIQAAWNLGLSLAHGEYVAFLGLDEANRADAFELMIDYLDAHPVVDWVQGNALIIDVNVGGSYVRDVMPYIREFVHKTDHYLDSCYLGFVGSLMRKRIFGKSGYFDERFRGAGDTEFKNRALPKLSVVTLPTTLGFFLNFPEERMTLSPLAEIEDIRAWYLYRSAPALQYAFRDTAPEVVVELFERTMGYSKTYFRGTCTDIELALNIAKFLEDRPGWRAYYNRIARYLPHLECIRGAYRTLDSLTLHSRATPVASVYDRVGLIETAAYAIVNSVHAIRFLGNNGFAARFTNDNRSHQHSALWASKASPLAFAWSALSGRLTWADLAGALDLSEVLSSANSNDPHIDVQLAWQFNDLAQVKRLHKQTAFGAFCPASVFEADNRSLEGELAAFPLVALDLLVGWKPSAGLLPDAFAYVDAYETTRPLYAGSEVVVVPADERTSLGLLRPFLQAVLFCRPIAATAALAPHVSALYPTLDLSPLQLADNPQAALEDAMRLLSDPRALELRRSAVTKLACALGPLVGVEVDASEWVRFDPDVAAANVLFRRVFEHGEAIPREAFEGWASEAGRARLAALWGPLVVTKDAPLLRTRHSFFRRLAAAAPWTETQLQDFIELLLEQGANNEPDASARRPRATSPDGPLLEKL